MKKLTYLVLAVGLVALGWFIGRRKVDNTQATQKPEQTAVASEVLKAKIFDEAFTEVSLSECIIEQLDSGRVDDAEEMLRTHQDGCILAMDNSLDSATISAQDMAALRELNASIQSSHGSTRETADRILARVARHRAEHPWTYKGDLPHFTDPEAETELAFLLKRASVSQR
jgi:hypothetical protein